MMYMRENSKLKYVLEVVNFFGRDDTVSMVRLNSNNNPVNQHVFDDPLPVWTRLGDDFHGYSAHWHKNALTAGGEVVAIAVGLQRSPVKFRCTFVFAGNDKPVTGLFSYEQVELVSSSSSSSSTHKSTEHFHAYKFLCKVNKDFGSKGPRFVAFHDIPSGSVAHLMAVNNLSQPTAVQNPVVHPNADKSERSVIMKSPIAACVDFLPYNLNLGKTANASDSPTDKEVFQFFLHHGIVGIQEFIVYHMNNFPMHLYDLLQSHQGVRMTKLPFNFPYELGDPSKIRQILELDCLLRTSAHNKFVLLLRTNEFFVPPSNVRLNRSFTQSLDMQSETADRYELPVHTLCPPAQATGRELLTEFSHDPSARNEHKVFIYRTTSAMDNAPDNVQVQPSTGLIHRLSKQCHGNAVNLREWRETLSADHSKFIVEVSKELRSLLV